MKKLKLPIILLVLISISSCQKEPNEENNSTNEINENVFVLNQETGLNLDSIGSNIMIFTQLTNQLDSIQTGDVFVGGVEYNHGTGFIRLIETIEEVNGNIVFLTKKGSLTDVFCNLDYDFQTDNNTQGLRTFPMNKTTLKTILFDKDGDINATTHDQVGAGFSMAYQASPILKITIEDCRVKYLKIGADMDGEITVDATLGADLKSFNVPDNSILGSELFSGQTFIGPVPITFRLVPRPVIGGEVYGEIDLDFTEKGERSFYGEYSQGVWKTESSANLEEIPFPLSGEFGVNFKCGIALNIEAQFADLNDARASFGGTVFGELNGNVDSGGIGTLSAKGGLELGIRMVAKAFSRFVLIDFEHVFLPYYFFEKEISSQDSCYDGIQNNDEEGVDCGGSNCPPCPCEHADIVALESLYESTTGSEWSHNDGWNTNCDPCNWYGVSCVNDRVKTIDLKNNNLKGELPPLLGQLTELTQLDLSDNILEGDISPSILVADKLVSIQLQNNQLSGEIPQNIGDLQSLTLLNLENNGLSGKLPEELSEMPTLQRLNLKDNNLSGCIENMFANLCDKDIDLSGNVDLPFNGDFERICDSEIGFCEGCLDIEAHNYNPFATSGNDADCETCEDGIQNGDEEDVDCGGATCQECDICDSDVFIDTRDMREYKIVGIGNQCWLGENLKYASPGSRCPEDNPSNCDIFGRYYPIQEFFGSSLPSSNTNPSGIQGICPDGWHIPSNLELEELYDFLYQRYFPDFGGDVNKKIFSALASDVPELWLTNLQIDNETKLSIEPSGFLWTWNGTWEADLGEVCRIYSTTWELDTYCGYLELKLISDAHGSVGISSQCMSQGSTTGDAPVDHFYTCRCVKD